MPGSNISLRDISDVNIDLNNIQDESVLSYDAGTGKFVARPPGEVEAVSGAVAAHNVSGTAHTDIRTLATQIATTTQQGQVTELATQAEALAGTDTTRALTSNSIYDVLFELGFIGDWFVDSVNGDDNFSGTSRSTSFATLTKLMTVLQASDVVALARGSVWQEQLTLPGNNITVRAFGSGAIPLFDCSNEIPSANFSATGGQTFVYETTITIVSHATETFVRAWENDVSLVRASSVANCEATAGSYFPSADNANSITLYIHATDSSDPTTSGKVYDYSARQAGIWGPTYSGISVIGIHGRRNLRDEGSIVTGPSATITDCLCEDGTKHNIYCGEGTTFTRTTCRNAYYGANNSTLFVAYTAVAAGLGLTFNQCYALMDTYSQYVSAFYFHNAGGADTFGAVTLTNCVAKNCLYGLDTYTTFTTLVIDGFTCIDVDYPIYPRKTCSVTNLTANIKNQKRLTYSIEAGVTFTLTNSTVTMDANAVASGGAIYTVANNVTVNITGVEFIDGGVSTVWIDLESGTGQTINASGCGFDYIRPYQNFNAAGLTLNSDFNHFEAVFLSFVINNVTYASVAAYQAATGQDAHSTIA